MKNSNGTIGNQTHDLPVCSVVPEPTVLLLPQPDLIDTEILVPYSSALAYLNARHITLFLSGIVHT
jgi:hypothetical protein